MKKIVLNLPEYYFIVLAILSGYTPPVSLNPFFICLITLIILQIVTKNRITGILLGTLFFLINLFFLGALISEFNEFTEFNYQAQQLLFVGISIWIFNVLTSLTMVYKYATMKVNQKIGYTS